jgi:hypothetical protein
MTTVTSNKFKSTTIYGTLSVIDNPNGNIISNTTLSGNLTVGGKINNIPVATIEYVSNLTSDAQEQINTKAPLASPTFTGTVSGITKAMVGLSNADNTTDLLKPISTATQTALNLLAPMESPSFTGTVSGITKSMVGLGDVQNTTDLNKPISTATQTALNLLAPMASPSFTGTVNGITKSMVGLGDVQNTTDLNKPISTATQTALNLLGGLSTNNSWSGTNTFNTSIPTTTLTPSLSSQFITKAYADTNYAGTGILSGTNSWTGTNTYNTNLPTSTLTPTTTSHLTNKAYVDLKAPLASPTFTGTVSGITKSMVGLGNIDNTTDLLKPLSTATQTALDLKAPSASPTFTGTVSGITKAMVGLSDVDNTTDLLKPISTATQTALDLKAPLASPTFTGTVTTSELTASGLITADNGLTISNGGINCININNSTDIYSNQYLRNLNHSNSGFCELFSNATTNDNIIIGSNVSTTRLTGQSVNIETDLYTTGLITTGGGITFNNGTVANNKLSNVYQMVFDSNYPNEKIILYDSGSSLYNYSIGVLSNTLFYSSPVNHNFYIGGTGTTPVVTMTSSGTTFTGTVSGITKSMVGLSNVDNTTDLLKPLSTATTNALNLKAPSASPTFTGTVSGITKSMVGLSDVDNTTDLLKPISTATTNALNLKAPLASPTFTGTVTTAELTVSGNITLGNGSVTPTTGQIGHRIGGLTGLATISGLTSNVSTITLTAGTWLLNGQVGMQSATAVAMSIQTYMLSFQNNGGITPMATEAQHGNGNNVAYTGYGNVNIGQYFSRQISQVVRLTSSVDFSLKFFVVYTGGDNFSNIGSYFNATRIA